MKRFFGCLCAILAVVLFMIGGYMLYDHLMQYKEGENAYEEIANIAHEEDSDEDDGADKPFTVDWESLKGTNIVAWIRMGDRIDYPVLQGTNNSYYLNHLYNGEYNLCGSIFMNCDNDPMLKDNNTIIYGHRTANGSMFGSLKDYLSPGNSNTEFSIYLPDGTKHTYAIFSVAKVRDGGDAYKYLFANDYKEYQEYMKSISNYDTGVPVDEHSKLVSLSTCATYSSSSKQRILLQGMEKEVVQVQEPASWLQKDQLPGL